MKKNKNISIIGQLNAMVDEIIAYINEMDEPKQYRVFSVPLKTTEVGAEMYRRCADKHFTNMINSIDKGRKDKALYHANKLKAQIAPVANDYPFKEGDKVEVIRYEHGWEPGYTAVIKEVYKCHGIYKYSAMVVEDYEGSCEHFPITIDHTRDARKY